jgi:hypothetical protein
MLAIEVIKVDGRERWETLGRQERGYRMIAASDWC